MGTRLRECDDRSPHLGPPSRVTRSCGCDPVISSSLRVLRALRGNIFFRFFPDDGSRPSRATRFHSITSSRSLVRVFHGVDPQPPTHHTRHFTLLSQFSVNGWELAARDRSLTAHFYTSRERAFNPPPHHFFYAFSAANTSSSSREARNAGCRLSVDCWQPERPAHPTFQTRSSIILCAPCRSLCSLCSFFGASSPTKPGAAPDRPHITRDSSHRYLCVLSVASDVLTRDL